MTPTFDDPTLRPRPRALIAAFAFGTVAGVSHAEPNLTPIIDPEDSRYVIGVAVNAAPEYEGADRTRLRLKPLFAYKKGRFRISTSGAGSVMGFAAVPIGSGVSAELISSERWKLGTALRFDNGRQSSDSARLAGLPEAKRTLRARFYVSYKIDEEWDAGAFLAQDLAGRKGGAELGLGVGYRHWLTPRTALSASVGLTLYDRRRMQTYFGIDDASAAHTGREPYAPGAGLQAAHTSIGIMTAITPRWVAFANLGASRLLGDAATSPLTYRQSSMSATVGLAYRCCD